MNVYICSAARTAIGTYGGTLRDVHSSELGTAAAKAAIERAGVDKEAIDEVLFGQVLQGGVGQNVARQVCLKSGLPITTPAMTLNKVCASSMRAISLGTQIIRSGENKMMLVGGCELAMSCDIRLASENASFGQPEVGLGITPGCGGTQRLARFVGAGKAKEMLYTARANYTAQDALDMGLVNYVYPLENLLDEAVKLAEEIAAQAPIAVSLVKEAVNVGMQTDLNSALKFEGNCFAQCFATEDQKYGMAYFLDKNRDKPAKEFKNK